MIVARTLARHCKLSRLPRYSFAGEKDFPDEEDALMGM